MLDVFWRDLTREFDLERHNSAIAALDDKVHFVFSSMDSEVANARSVGLCEDSHAEGHERFEEVAEQRPITNDLDPALLTSEEGGRLKSK